MPSKWHQSKHVAWSLQQTPHNLEQLECTCLLEASTCLQVICRHAKMEEARARKKEYVRQPMKCNTKPNKITKVSK
jgi:hypothetical protein